MCSLVGKPVVLLQYVYFFMFRKQLKMVIVGMTVQADIIIVQYRLLKVNGMPHADLVIMRSMAFPACESFFLQFEMNTLLIFTFYFFKFELGELFIPAMAVNAIVFLLHPQLTGMRKFGILPGMTVCTAEAFMIGAIKFNPVHDPFRKHQSLYLCAKILVCILVFALSMTSETSLIIFKERGDKGKRILLVLNRSIDAESPCTGHYENHQET
jgi:hypothetical protein